MREVDLKKLESIINHDFKNIAFLHEALTHRSYINEHESWSYEHNERLEFLGDAVLELIVTEELFLKLRKEPEGKLTLLRAALVNYQFLSKVAASFNLDKFLYLSKGEAKDNSKAKEVILANAFEALVGALYLDGGIEVTKKFVNNFVMIRLEDFLDESAHKDPKSLLQELLQDKSRVTPSYKLLSEYGPDHKKLFRMGVYMKDKKIGEGEGYSKQEAETKAAQSALEILVSKK